MALFVEACIITLTHFDQQYSAIDTLTELNFI